MTVLVVDDEPRIREVVKEYCLLEGFNVLEAEDGYEAIDLVKAKKIDIIVLDIKTDK